MVTKVVNKATQEVFALKAIEKGRVEQHRIQEHVLREVETQRGLNHPNIVRLYDCFDDPDRIYLLLEYAPGGHLFSRIQKCGRLGDLEAATILVDVVRALVDLHERGIIHRDLKPENVLLFPGGRAKLADFGWCAELKSAGRMTFCGTMDYLSPEMVSRQLHDHRVDTWAVGVLLYEMLIGSPPFYAKSTNQSIHRILTADLRFPDTLSAAARELVRGLIKVDPENRMDLKEVLTHQWVREAMESTPAQRPELQPAPLGKALPRVLPLLLDVLDCSSKDLGCSSKDLPLHTLSARRDKSLLEKMLGTSEDLPMHTLSALQEECSSPEDMQNPGAGVPEGHAGTHASASAPRPVPKIGGFSSLEGLAGASTRGGRGVPVGSAPPTGSGASSTRCSGTQDTGRTSTDATSDGASSFFGDALRPCRRAWTHSEGSESSGGKTEKRRGKDFMLDSCLEPVSEVLSARQDTANRSWNSAARPVEASATPWFAPIGEVSSPASAQVPPLALLREREVRESKADSTPSTARSRETPRTWRETDTFSAVRSWVRAPVKRQVLARELDRTISLGMGGSASPKDGFAQKASSFSTGTPASACSESSSFTSEGDFIAQGMADADTPSSRRDEHSAAMPSLLLSRPSNANVGFSDGTPTRAKW